MRTYRLNFSGTDYGAFTLSSENPPQLVAVEPADTAVAPLLEAWAKSAIARHPNTIEYLDNYPSSGYWTVLPVASDRTDG